MKNVVLYLMIIISVGSCVERSPIQLSAAKDSKAVAISNGVFLTPALQMERAKSYNGLQALNGIGSIELRTNQNFEELLKYYSPEQIKYRDGKLLRHQPVSYDSTTSGLYVEYLDKTYNRRRLVLLLQNEEHNYLLKAFHNEDSPKGVSNKFRSTLQSVYIGKFTKYEEPFSKVHLYDLTAMYRSRDNLFPTEEPDSLYLKIADVPSVQPSPLSMQKVLRPIISEYTDQPYGIKYEEMTKGRIAFVTIDDNDTKAVIMLIAEDVGSGLVVVGYGNELVSLPEVTSLVKSKFLMQLN